jgi:hypothetical protein
VPVVPVILGVAVLDAVCLVVLVWLVRRSPRDPSWSEDRGRDPRPGAAWQDEEAGA